MNESAQTSVEQINLVAAQLRYKIDSTLQQTSQQRQHVHIFREEVLENSSSGAIAVDAKMAIDDKFSSSATLASDCLHREIVDLKQVIDKLGSQIRSKDAALKVIKDELKQEKLNGEILRRDNRQIGADAKANERYVKCVQIEYELLHNMASKSQEAFLAIGNESIRHATEFDKSAKMVKKQMKEIVEKNIEIRNLQEDIKRLHIDIANQRATAGVSTISLKLLQIELDHVSEKERRFTARIASLTERVERERHINKMLNQTAEETNLNAATSSEGIQIANQQQADLLIRYSYQ